MHFTYDQFQVSRWKTNFKLSLIYFLLVYSLEKWNSMSSTNFYNTFQTFHSYCWWRQHYNVDCLWNNLFAKYDLIQSKWKVTTASFTLAYLAAWLDGNAVNSWDVLCVNFDIIARNAQASYLYASCACEINQWQIQDIPDGSTNPRNGRAPTYCLAKCCRKLQKNKEIETRMGARNACPLDLPMCM